MSGGVPPHVPTAETRLIVKELYQAGITKARLAKRLKIDEDTLNKHYEDELDNAKEHLINAMSKSLARDALNGNEKAREFYLKCQGRWSYAKDEQDQKMAKTQQSVLEKLIDKL